MENNDEKLPGDYIAGFVDGEGRFSLKFRVDRKLTMVTEKSGSIFIGGWNLQLF